MKVYELKRFPGYGICGEGKIYKLKNGQAIELKIVKLPGPYNMVKISGKVYSRGNIVCQAVNGPPPTKNHVARRIDGNKKNDHPSNLKWGLKSDPITDKQKAVSKKVKNQATPEISEVPLVNPEI